MSQMVLPQATPQGPKADNGLNSSQADREKSGESQFDSVSRAEQQRLDRKQAEKRDQARADDKARNDQVNQDKAHEKRPDDRSEPATGEQARNGNNRPEDAKADPSGKAEASDRAGESAPSQLVEQETPQEVVPLTFADLQALLMPAGGNASQATAVTPGALGAGNGAVPGVQAFAGMIAGMPGLAGGKPGQTAGQGAGSAASQGLALTEALLSGVAADASKTQDTSSLQGALRFQAAAEVASQQLASPNGAKLPTEAAALRGYTTSIDVPVNHAEWGDKLVGKLTWLTARNMSVAEIHLTPPDMGPMEVRVQVQQEQANITVHSANPAVRDQLELHSHRLRDMLSEQGLSLAQFDVSDSPQQQTGEDSAGEGEGNSGSTLADAGADEQDSSSGSLDLTWKGEVDVFA